jgi:hypothetical protein
MIKYSLQNECLENIEAFSDEQMSSDMAVIESVLDIFDKTILMMELSNEPVDIPDVSMFMESAFFQEQNEGDQSQAADGNTGDGEKSNPAPTTDQSSGNNTSSDNNTQNNTMSEADRKAYNKEHWVRMKNKKGKVENIFISIIAFIPRLLGFLIQCIVKLFKKIFNKDTNQKANECAKTTSEQRQEVVKELGTDTVSADTETAETSTGANNNPPENVAPAASQTENSDKNNSNGNNSNNGSQAGSINVNNMTTKSFYNKSVESSLQEFLKIIDKLDVSKTLMPVENIENPYTYYANAFIKLQNNIKNDLQTAKQSLENSLKMDLVEIPIGDQYQNAINAVGNTLSDIEKGAERVNSEYSGIVNKLKHAKVPSVQGDAVNENMKNVNAAVAPLRDLLNQMKIMIKDFNISTKNFADEYAKYSKNVITIWNVLNKNGSQQNQPQQPQAQPQQNQGQPQPPQPPVNNNGGGENNG